MGYDIRLLEVFKLLKVVEYLEGDPLLKGDGGQVGILSPHVVVFMKPGELWKKERVSLFLLYITVLLSVINTSSRARLRLGGYRHSVLTITVDNKVGVDVPEEPDVPERKYRTKLRTSKVWTC